MVAPWLGLAVRLWLAQAFLAAQLHGMMAAAGLSVLLGRESWSAPFAALANSDFGFAVQAACPLLLAAGLLSRAAAVAMLLQAALLAAPGVPAATQTLWVALLLRVVVAGPGALALDGLLGRGAASLALPGAAALGRAAGWLRRRVPAYQLALRLWLAAVVAGTAFSAIAMTDTMLPRAPMLPDGLDVGIAAALTFVLAAGAGVRLVALALLMLLLGGQGGGEWALLLAVLAVGGAGPVSVDAWLAARLRRMMPEPDRSAWPRVVVVGAGFGGIAAVRGLRRTPCRITLIDRRNYHLFQPLLYQVATASLSPGDIATPAREMLRDQANARVLLGDVTGVDPAAGTVLMERGAVGYDYLVLATGAQHSYFGRDDWAPFAPGLKTIEDGTAIRRRLLLAFEEAENAASDAERAGWLTFVVVGGGPTGVELAGAIAELARYGMRQEFRRIDPSAARVVLVQSGPRLLPAFPEALSHEAARALRGLGVEVMLDERVAAVSAAGPTVAGAVLPARTVLWAAGVMASPAAGWLGAKADPSGRIVVDEDLSVPGFAQVFAVGDTTLSEAWAGRPVPGLAPAAKQGGAYVAKVIAAEVTGRARPGPFRYRHFGSLATIGRKSAVADFGAIRLRGGLAWWLWGAAHIAFLVGGRNRASVIVQWLWAYLTFRRAARLITGPEP